MQNQKTDLLVSVLMITYNHSLYLAQALDSVLAQERDFNLEIVIGEDCSTDNTRAIVLDYQQRYPGVVRALLPTSNIGAMNNQIQVMKACRGRYIAILEGDDYWTDPHKLKRQVAYLETHPKAALVFTDCALVNELGQVIEENFVPAHHRHSFTLRELLREYCPPALTVLYRNIISTIPPIFRSVMNGDLVLFTLIGQHGTLDYLPGMTAHYRYHSGGVWSSQSQERKFYNNLKTGLAILEYLGPEYRPELMSALNWYYNQLGTILWQKKGRRREFWKHYLKFGLFSLRTINKEILVFTFRLLMGKINPSSPIEPD